MAEEKKIIGKNNKECQLSGETCKFFSKDMFTNKKFSLLTFNER